MYFPVPFSYIGDRTTVPIAGTETGTINFTYGYGSNYSEPLDTSPGALQVDRFTFNYMLYQITVTLQGLFQTGLPPWISAADNQSVSYPYAANALTFGRDGNNYFSLSGGNTTTPGTNPAAWLLFNPARLASRGDLPLTGVTGGTYSFATLGAGAVISYTASAGAITAVTAVTTGGAGYVVGDLITPNAGNYDAAIRVTGVSIGAVTTVEVLYGGTGFVTAATVETQPANARRGKITLAGTITTNVTLIMPNGTLLANAASWVFANNTIGAHTTTVFVSNGSNATTGTGVLLPQGVANSKSMILDTDGVTDFYVSNPAVTGVFTPMTQITVTSSPGTTASNTSTVTNAGSLLTVPLPPSATDGDELRVIGVGSGGWHISQAAGQQIIFGNMSTTAGVGGSLASTNRYDSVMMKYSSAATAWMVTSSIGNITVV